MPDKVQEPAEPVHWQLPWPITVGALHQTAPSRMYTLLNTEMKGTLVCDRLKITWISGTKTLKGLLKIKLLLSIISFRKLRDKCSFVSEGYTSSDINMRFMVITIFTKERHLVHTYIYFWCH